MQQSTGRRVIIQPKVVPMQPTIQQQIQSVIQANPGSVVLLGNNCPSINCMPSYRGSMASVKSFQFFPGNAVNHPCIVVWSN